MLTQDVAEYDTVRMRTVGIICNALALGLIIMSITSLVDPIRLFASVYLFTPVLSRSDCLPFFKGAPRYCEVPLCLWHGIL